MRTPTNSKQASKKFSHRGLNDQYAGIGFGQGLLGVTKKAKPVGTKPEGAKPRLLG